jgi:hypothetical protein
MIVASIVLAIGVSLLTISRKEFDLSSSATQSSNAFYAADSGIGCAEYWANNSEFSTSSYSESSNPVINNFQCSNGISNIDVYMCSSNQASCSSNVPASINPPSSKADSGYGDTYEFTFYVPFLTDGTPTNKSCSAVTVDKYIAKSADGTYYHTYTDITSAGYNIGYDPSTKDCSSPSPKKVNRTIELTY